HQALLRGSIPVFDAGTRKGGDSRRYRVRSTGDTTSLQECRVHVALTRECKSGQSRRFLTSRFGNPSRVDNLMEVALAAPSLPTLSLHLDPPVH
ncbi:hypothetical protein T310_8846, partial [Rasamsonia emersonii CBS 393.64]